MASIERKKHHLLRTAGGIALVLSLLICTWLTGGAVAWGWIDYADHYGTAFRTAGIAVLFLNCGMTAAVILRRLRCDLPAAVLGTVCGLLHAGIMVWAVWAAELRGWSGQTEASFGRSAASVWRQGLSGNLLTLLLLLVLTLTRYFSADAAAARAERREAKNAPAPSVLGDRKSDGP